MLFLRASKEIKDRSGLLRTLTCDSGIL